MIENKERIFLFGNRAKELSQEDIKKLADDFLQQKNREKKSAYLPVFENIKFPYADYQPFLEIAKGKSKRYDTFVFYACEALKHFSGADIREFALEKLNEKRVPEEYLCLLIKNYKKGDAKLLTEIIKRCKNDEEIHSVVFGLIEIYKVNKTKECKEPLEMMYDRLTCGVHREDVVEILIENKVISDKIKREIQFDSAKRTRKLYEKIG